LFLFYFIFFNHGNSLKCWQI